MNRKHKFSIRKLSVGVFSVCFGMVVFGSSAEAQEIQNQEVVSNEAKDKLDNKKLETEENIGKASNNLVNEKLKDGVDIKNETESSAKDIKVENEKPTLTSSFRSVVSTETTQAKETGEKTPLEALKENQSFQDNELVSSYDASKKAELNNVLQTNFETKSDDVAMSDIVSKKSFLSAKDITTYLIPLLNEFKQKNNLPFSVASMTPEQRRLFDEYTPIAQQEALRLANAQITNNDEMQSVAKSTKNAFNNLLNKNLLGTKDNLTIGTLKSDLPTLLRGVFFLDQQYNFEDGLIDKLVFAPHTIKGISPDELTPYDRLKEYGGRYINTQKGGLLNQTRELFNTRGVEEFTGFNSIFELVEHLAKEKGMTAAEYYKNRSEAILGETEGSSIYETIKNSKPELYLPLLSQGKGVYAGASKNAFTIGMTETYLDQYPPEILRKERGQAQPKNPFFLPMLNGFNNYMNFLESVKKKDIPFVTATDSLNHKYDTQKIGVWSKADGGDAADAVRRFFTPLKMRHPYVKSGVGIGGVSTGASTLVAYETRLMNKDMSGVGLFTHEMTHGNDQAAMYGGIYGNHGRRAGQGPEVFARGLFEAIDNTQNANSPYIPVFNLNTAIDIKESADRVQARQPLKDKQTMETYMRNLMDLVAYLEAREAEVVFDKLDDSKKRNYFNKVSQIRPTSETSLHITKAGEGKISTNDRFSLFDKNSPSLNSIKDLIDNGAVSGQFIPRGVSPLNNEITTNQYDSIPLLESFYAVQAQNEADKNTVGDISFKRHAYEILAWKGWEAYVDYASDKYSNDSSAFNAILADEANNSWAKFKEEQYNRVSKLKPINNLWDEKQLKSDLEGAIKKDLEIIENYKREVEDLYKTKTEVTDTDLTNIVVKYNLRSNLTNVRKVKLDILRKALVHNDLMAPVLTNSDYDIIYVSNSGTGNGETETTPMNNLKEAIKKVREGGKIVLVDNITDRTAVTIDKPLTIEGSDATKTLLLNDKLTITKDVTLKGFTLNMNPESTNNGTLEVIGSRLNMENINTTVGRQEDIRPNVILSGENPTLDVTGSTILNQIQTKSSATVNLNSTNVKVNNGLVDMARNGSTVNVLSKSNFVSSFVGNRESDLNVTLDSNFPILTLSNVNNLTLVNRARATLNNVEGTTVGNELTINSGTTLTVNENIINVNTLAGGGELILDSDSKVTAENAASSADDMTITFRKSDLNYIKYEGKVFVEVKNKVGTPTVNLSPISKSLTPNEQNQWVYNNEHRLVFTFESADANKQLPSGVDDLLPEERVVRTSENVILPKFNEKINDPDGKGEWVFSHWNNQDDEQIESLIIGEDLLTDVYGIWRYQLKVKDPVVEIRKEVIPYVVEYQGDNNIPAGQKVIARNGVNGEKTYTITDGVSNQGVVTKDVVNELVKVGIKPKVEENIIDQPTSYEADNSIVAGTIVVVTEGKPGAIIKTTTYELDLASGEVTPATNEVRHNPEERVVKVGTQSKVERTTIEPGTRYEADETLSYGERQEIPGTSGERVVTTTYTLDENGQVQASQPRVAEIPDVDKIIKVGTKPTITVREIPYTTTYQADATKPYTENYQPVEKVAGVNGTETTTTSYNLNTVDGTITESNQVNTINPTTRILVVKIGSTVRKEVIEYSTIEQPTDKLLKGVKEIKVVGKNGERTYTDSYTLDTITGEVSKKIDTIGEITLEPINGVVLVGGNIVSKVPDNYPIVELSEAIVRNEEIAFDIIEEIDNSLLSGERIVKTAGEKGVREIITVSGEEVSNKVTKEPVNEVVRVGTKVESKVPDTAPLVDLPIAEIGIVPGNYPTVELPIYEGSVASIVPNDYPVVKLPEAVLSKKENNTLNSEISVDKHKEQLANENQELVVEKAKVDKEKRVLPNTGLTSEENSLATIGALGFLGILFTRRKNSIKK